jgi:general secretion pathway protein G
MSATLARRRRNPARQPPADIRRNPHIDSIQPGLASSGHRAMTTHHRRHAFTLIEVLIVVVIMAVLAAIVIPHFSQSTEDAKATSVRHNLEIMRTEIEVYKLGHQETVPDGTSNLAQLTSATNAAGQIGSMGNGFPHGPYFSVVPMNAFSGSNRVRLFTGTGAPTASGAADAGWIYQPATGQIWCDNPVYTSIY